MQSLYLNTDFLPCALNVTKSQKLFDTTKPQLANVRALFYVLKQVTEEAVPILNCGLILFSNRQNLFERDLDRGYTHNYQMIVQSYSYRF